MSAVKSGVSLRTLVLTPERILSFLIPSRSPFLVSPRLRRGSPDRTRLLSDNDDDSSGTSSPATPTSAVTSPRFVLRLRTPRPARLHHSPAVAEEPLEADTDVGAATSLAHVQKVSTPRGSRGVLAANLFLNRRQSPFHRSTPVKVTVSVTDADPRGPEETHPVTPSDPGRSRVSMRPVKALGLQVMKELKKPAAALRALSPSSRGTSPR